MLNQKPGIPRGKCLRKLIKISGARQHNLTNLQVDISREALVTIIPKIRVEQQRRAIVRHESKPSAFSKGKPCSVSPVRAPQAGESGWLIFKCEREGWFNLRHLRRKTGTCPSPECVTASKVMKPRPPHCWNILQDLYL
jgi:hypothetical protein